MKIFKFLLLMAFALSLGQTYSQDPQEKSDTTYTIDLQDSEMNSSALDLKDMPNGTIQYGYSDYDQDRVLSAQVSDNPFDVVDDIKEAKTWADLFGLDGAIMSLLMIVLGYLSKFIPGLKAINSNTYRVLSTSIVIVIGFVLFGFEGAALKGILSYVFATSTYEVILKWIFPTPKPDPVSA